MAGKKKNVFVSMVLDRRGKVHKEGRKKGQMINPNDVCPVKLMVYSRIPKIQKRYETEFFFTEKEFQSIWETLKPREEYKNTRKKMQAALDKAEEVAESLNPFSIDEFYKKFFRNSGDSSSVLYYYDEMIKKFRKDKEHSTADNFQCALNSFIKFLTPEEGKNKGIEPRSLQFAEINKEWLENYERYMVEGSKVRTPKSLTTVSMYTRTLRQAFNEAISNKDIDPELYPFGSKRYSPPAVKKVKKALKTDQLKTLYAGEPKTAEQKRGKDFWYLSYSMNGLNIKDILQLRYKDMDSESIVLYRAKTKKAKKGDLTPITIYLNDYIRKMIKEYGNPEKKPDNYIFPVLDPEKTSFENHRITKNFINALNQGFRKFAKAQGFDSRITTYWARHSFATKLIRDGASLEFIGEAFGHADTKTTKGYFEGFEDEVKKEFAKNLMDF